MGISHSNYLAMQARLAKHVAAPANADSNEVGSGGLHSKIIDWCDSQWPKWKYRHSRTDRKTSEELGVEDFTIFAPHGRTLHVECKAKGKKQTTEQLGWALQLKQLGHEVHVVYSMEQFVELAKTLETGT